MYVLWCHCIICELTFIASCQSFTCCGISGYLVSWMPVSIAEHKEDFQQSSINTNQTGPPSTELSPIQTLWYAVAAIKWLKAIVIVRLCSYHHSRSQNVCCFLHVCLELPPPTHLLLELSLQLSCLSFLLTAHFRIRVQLLSEIITQNKSWPNVGVAQW